MNIFRLFILNFLLPKTWLLYLASVIIGVGAALIWTGQGNYLTLNSRASTISRNSGVFWALLQLRYVFVLYEVLHKYYYIVKVTRFLFWQSMTNVTGGGGYKNVKNVYTREGINKWIFSNYIQQSSIFLWLKTL